MMFKNSVYVFMVILISIHICNTMQHFAKNQFKVFIRGFSVKVIYKKVSPFLLRMEHQNGQLALLFCYEEINNQFSQTHYVR